VILKSLVISFITGISEIEDKGDYIYIDPIAGCKLEKLKKTMMEISKYTGREVRAKFQDEEISIKL